MNLMVVVAAAAAEAILTEPYMDEAAAHMGGLDPLAYPYTFLRVQPGEQIVLACNNMEGLQDPRQEGFL